ncbi:MAG: aminotransferase class I/II-fold pyridoxal phosphate-dependent enzyme [Clostridia bacterium]|nr:aminotransferase class I/II-fold pyridoxal phosphate-dependent enzyme [Clostridia bacterium]
MDYRKVINPVADSIKPSGIRKFFDIVEEMDDVITLGVGEPDFPTPWAVRQAGIRSLEDGKTRYTSNWGLKKLREEISAYMNRRFDLTYSPDNEILVTVGGSEAIDVAIRTLVSPGDEVLIPEPSFVCYRPIVELAGGMPVPIVTKAENDFRLTGDELKNAITGKTKVLIMPFPCNPTGGVMRKEHLEEVAQVLRGTDIMVISDEIYAELTYGESHVSIASREGMSERTIVIGGFSKSYSMTGWRLGYACGPKEIMQVATKIHQFAIMSAPTTAQYAAIEALRSCDEDLKNMVNDYNMRRRFVVNGFRRIGLDCFEPNGAFYAFPCIKSTGLTSEEFCEKLLYSEKVALVPGNAFGESGEGYVRASYCYSIDHLKEALRRIENFLKKL